MKKYLVLTVIFFIGCADFPTRLELIEKDKVRFIEFIYEPVDAAPGDTVKLTAVFAGRKVTSEMINWNVSHKVVFNPYGADSAFEIHPLAGKPAQVYFTERTSCIALSFVIPDSIMYYSSAIKNNWTEILPPDYRGNIPEEFRGLSKTALLDTIGALARLIKTSNETELKMLKTVFDDSVMQSFSGVLQMLTVNMRIFAGIRGAYTVESDFVVRYNRIFNRLSEKYIMVNNNPVIDSVIIYKVSEKKMLRYNPAEARHTSYRLYGEGHGSETVIPVDRSCSYFIRTFTSKKDMGLSLGDFSKTEDHISHPFYEHNADETKDISAENFMNIKRIDNDSILVLYPPGNDKLKQFVIWMKVRDNFANENMRPLGAALKEFRGQFQY